MFLFPVVSILPTFIKLVYHQIHWTNATPYRVRITCIAVLLHPLGASPPPPLKLEGCLVFLSYFM